MNDRVIKNTNVSELAWVFSEFEKHERGNSWYVWFGIVVGLLLIYAFWNFNLLFGFIIIVASVTILVRHTREPREIAIKINADGIRLENKLYIYQDIKNFWLIYKPKKTQMLYLAFKNITNPITGIPLMKQNPIIVREFLNQYLEEDLTKENELVRDTLSRVLKL